MNVADKIQRHCLVLFFISYLIYFPPFKLGPFSFTTMTVLFGILVLLTSLFFSGKAQIKADLAFLTRRALPFVFYFLCLALSSAYSIAPLVSLKECLKYGGGFCIALALTSTLSKREQGIQRIVILGYLSAFLALFLLLLRPTLLRQIVGDSLVYRAIGPCPHFMVFALLITQWRAPRHFTINRFLRVSFLLLGIVAWGQRSVLLASIMVFLICALWRRQSRFLIGSVSVIAGILLSLWLCGIAFSLEILDWLYLKLLVLQKFGRLIVDGLGNQYDHGRQMLWGSAFKLWQQSPWVGHGPATFAQSSDILLPSVVRGTIHAPHNWLVLVLSSQGLLGLLGFLTIIICAYWHLHHAQKEKFTAAFCALAILYMLLFGGVAVLFSTGNLLLLFWLLLMSFRLDHD